MIKIERAQRKQAKLRLAITGPSGSGKTMSALLIAFGIGPKVLMADTENGSGSLYADAQEGPLKDRPYDVTIINPPYTIPKYLEIIEAAERGGYDVLIFDTISPAWAGEGGLLDKKTALDARAGSNPYTNWAPISKEFEQFRSHLLQIDTHLICALRSKQEYFLEDIQGKKVPKKVGLAPIQRDGIEYEFTTVFDLAMDHNAMSSKDRTGLFDGQVFRPTIETGKLLMTWLNMGKPIEKPVPESRPTISEGAKPSQLDAILDELAKAGYKFGKKQLAYIQSLQGESDVAQAVEFFLKKKEEFMAGAGVGA